MQFSLAWLFKNVSLEITFVTMDYEDLLNSARGGTSHHITWHRLCTTLPRSKTSGLHVFTCNNFGKLYVIFTRLVNPCGKEGSLYNWCKSTEKDVWTNGLFHIHEQSHCGVGTGGRERVFPVSQNVRGWYGEILERINGSSFINVGVTDKKTVLQIFTRQ